MINFGEVPYELTQKHKNNSVALILFLYLSYLIRHTSHEVMNHLSLFSEHS